MQVFSARVKLYFVLNASQIGLHRHLVSVASLLASRPAQASIFAKVNIQIDDVWLNPFVNAWLLNVGESCVSAQGSVFLHGLWAVRLKPDVLVVVRGLRPKVAHPPLLFFSYLILKLGGRSLSHGDSPSRFLLGLERLRGPRVSRTVGTFLAVDVFFRCQGVRGRGPVL